MQIPSNHIDPDTLAAYALDALPPDELIVIGTHLVDCTTCQQEVASFRAVGEYLPHGLPAVDPPPDLRDKVLARARATSRRSAVRSTPQRSASPSAMPAVRVPWLQRLMPFAVAVALVLGVLFGRYWPTEAPTLAEQPGAQAVALSGQGSGTFAVAAEANRAQLVVDGLPPLPAGQVYQLWLLDGDTPISVGTFSVDAQGRGRLEFRGLAWSSSYRTVAITAEQQGGSPTPTSTIVVSGGF